MFTNAIERRVLVQNGSNNSAVMSFDAMDGHEFECFCADVLRRNGYRNVQVTQGSGDYGIDILAEKDSISYAIQCKCYSGKVGNKAVQEAYSGKAVYNRMVGVVLTNSFFTSQAIETARRTSVVLWDRRALLQMVEHAYPESASRHTSNSRDKKGNVVEGAKKIAAIMLWGFALFAIALTIALLRGIPNLDQPNTVIAPCISLISFGCGLSLFGMAIAAGGSQCKRFGAAEFVFAILMFPISRAINQRVQSTTLTLGAVIAGIIGVVVLLFVVIMSIYRDFLVSNE